MPQPANLASSYDATWDAWNRLVKLQDGSDTVAEYGYDGLNRRIVKKVYESGTLDETRHCYYSDRAQCLEERIDSSTDSAVQYLWGIRFVDDLVLRDRDTNGDGTLDERLYALCDPRFSVVAITDDTGTVQERYGYDGYGSTSIYSSSYVPRVSSNFAWEFRYTGRRQDLESLLYFFRARYYHAPLGRFLSRDPAGYVDGMSLYRAYFVPGDVDPTGKYCVECVCRYSGRDDQIFNVETDCRSGDDEETCCKKKCPGSFWRRCLGDNSPEYTGDWSPCKVDTDDCLRKCKEDQKECNRKAGETYVLGAKDCAASKNPWVVAACEAAAFARFLLHRKICAIEAAECRKNCSEPTHIPQNQPSSQPANGDRVK